MLPLIIIAVLFQNVISAVVGDSTCDPPPQIGGTQRLRLNDSRLTIGTVVTYLCEFGYVTQNWDGFRSICQIDPESGNASWTNPVVVCKPQSCGYPGSVPHADRSGSLFTFPNKVEFHCQQGYKMKGLFVRYCQTDGQWSGDLPTCEKKCLADPPRILNGRPENFSGDQLRVNYICDAGYQMRGHFTVYCKDGKWEEQLPSCVAEKCSAEPPRILNGRPANFSGDQLRVNYICDAGYQMRGHSTVYCKGGKWEEKLPSCVAGAAVPFPNIEESISVSANSSNNSPKPAKPIIVQAEDCTCSYRLRNSSVVAKVNGTILQYGDTVKKGDTTVLHCKDEKEHLVWPNKMRTEGYASLSCDECQVWKGKNLPTCNITRQGDFFIALNRTMKIQPNGVLEFHRKENVQIQCITYDMVEDPVWYFYKKNRNFVFTCTSVFDGGKRGILLNIPEFKWNYTGTYECTSRRSRRYQYRSSKLELQMKRSGSLSEHTTAAAVIPTASPVESTSRKQNAEWIEQFGNGTTSDLSVPGNQTSGDEDCFCIYNNGTKKPFAFVNGKQLRFGDKVKRGDTIKLRCRDPAMHLVLSNGTRVLETAALTCDVCQTWGPTDLPSCKAAHRATGCLTGDFVESAPENLVLNLLGITTENQPVGSKLSLHCEDDMVIYGTTTKATCGPLGKWEFGDALCVFGCHLNVNNASSQLIIKPAQQNFRIGDQAILLCPPGLELTANVKKVMCLGNRWSHDIPGCRKIKSE